jgi:hypothetical protein
MAVDPCRAFFPECNGLEYYYETGHWYRIECRAVPPSDARPAGLKYALSFFGPGNVCPVRYDNSHRVGVRCGGAAYDHWHRFARDELVPYAFITIETLLADFFADIDQHLPSHLRSD